MGTKTLIKSIVQKKGGSNSMLISAFDNANEEAIKQDRKDQNERKGNKK